ncbi:hypothetical protein [Deinococcus planocerae]|uniref:hypothetical protein n=1 Tax=Deinococcus planocerae TaxID=1737569 RepID=UPI0011AFC05E|nr:hypothetical protein [Deinococcus planocerae]
MIVVGYVLIEGHSRTEWMHSSVPETVYTPTECVCTLHPSNLALTWMEDSQTKTVYMEGLRLDQEERQKFQAEVDKLCNDSLWGTDGVFSEYMPAANFLNRWFQGRPDVGLYELSIPDDLLPSFLDATAPPASNTLLTGKHLAAQKAALPFPGTKALGFEVWGVQPWGDMHTSVCYDVRDGFVRDLGATFNRWGLLPTLELAREAAIMNNDAEGGSVGDSYWFPIQIAEISVEAKI